MMAIAAAVMVAAGTPAPVKKPVTSIIHGNNEYWGHRIDSRHFRTCDGRTIVVDPREKDDPIDVSCGNDGFDEHALHPTPKPKPRVHATRAPHR
jgi:hypothetical protein